MLRPITQRSVIATLLLTTVACTQAPAQIDLRGQNNYTRTGTNYAANNSAASYATYVPTAGGAQTQSSAAVSSIGVSELSPPLSRPAPQSAPFKLHAAAASDALDQSFSLSPKGKASKEQMVSDVSSPKKPAGLDSIVSNDDSVVSKKPMKTKKTDMASSAGFMWPVGSKKILSQFGPKGNGKANDGINIASSEGEPVWAAADGEVVYVGNELEGYGNIAIIKHSDNKTTTYAHLSRYTVDKYDRIKQGDIIGYVGNTGNVKEPQLHFAIRDGKDAVDPLKYLNSDVASLH